MEFGVVVQGVLFVPDLKLIEGVRDALDEVGFLLDQSSETVGAKHLQ